MDWIFLIICFTVFFIFVWSLARGRKPLRYLFYFWIVCFNFGPRAVTLFGLDIFYLEGITWVVFLMLLFRLNFFIFNEKGIFPKYTVPLFTLFLIGIVTALTNFRSFKVIFEEFSPFLCLIPTFCITFAGFKYLNVRLEQVIKIFIVGVAILTAGGLAFYFFPDLTRNLPRELFSGDSVLIDIGRTNVLLDQGVVMGRGGASFWGQLLISAYMLLLLFPIYALRDYLGRDKKGWFCVFLSLAMFINILINGQRSVWAGFLLGVALYSLFKGFRGISAALVFIFILNKILPKEILFRFYSLFNVSDVSWAGRVTRYENASKLIFQHPFFGSGWGASGWVHDVILQMSANLGIITTLIFCLWFRKLLLNALQIYRNPEQTKVMKLYILSFSISVVAFLGPMMGESAINWPHLMIPFWFFCAVLHNFQLKHIKIYEPDKEIEE